MRNDSAGEGARDTSAGAGSAVVSVAEVVGALEHLDVAVLVRKLDGTVVLANSAFASMLGYSRDELAGLNAKQFVTADQVHMVEESVNWLRDGQMRGFSGDGRMMAKDGSVLRIRLSVTTVVYDGERLAVCFIEDWSDVFWSDPNTEEILFPGKFPDAEEH